MSSSCFDKRFLFNYRQQHLRRRTENLSTWTRQCCHANNDRLHLIPLNCNTRDWLSGGWFNTTTCGPCLAQDNFLWKGPMFLMACWYLLCYYGLPAIKTCHLGHTVSCLTFSCIYFSHCDDEERFIIPSVC